MQVSPIWALALAALAGGLGVVLITRMERRSYGRQRNGVPEVLRAVAQREGRLEPWQGTAYASKAALTTAAGGSAGLEGPVVVFGASTASGLARRLRLPRDRVVLWPPGPRRALPPVLTPHGGGCLRWKSSLGISPSPPSRRWSSRA